MRGLLLIGAILCSSALAFCLVSIICSVLMQGRIQTSGRIAGLRSQPDAQGKHSRRSIAATMGNRRKGALQSKKARKRLEKLEAEFYDLGMHVPVESFLVVWAAVTLAVPAVLSMLGMPLIACIAIAVTCAFLPLLYMNMRKNKRRAKIEAQLVDAITMLISAIKAGHSFQSALADISRDMEAPISEEFGRVFRETQRGMSLDESMERMADRVGSDDLSMLCTAVCIQRQIGGNLSEVLENIAATVKARLELKAEIKTRTSSGRMSGYVIGALPVLILLAVAVFNPSYVEKLFAPSGRFLLVISAALEITGFLIIRKVVNIKY